MLKDGYSIRRSLLRLCFLLSVVLTGCASLYAQPSQAPESERQPPTRGIRVLGIIPGGQAEQVGLQPMDTLSRYGKFTVVDDSTYFKAREAYLKKPDVKVELEIWRGRTRLTFRVFPGKLDIYMNEYNAVEYEFDSLIERVDVMHEIPAYSRQVEFKDEFDQESIDESLAKAKAIIERSEVEGSLTPTQILVARISMILDEAPEEELKKQDVLLAEFVRNQPPEYIGYLGGRFMKQQHFRPARELLKNYLLTHPDDISQRLNLGYVSYHLGLWDEAEAAADLALANPKGLSQRGFIIAYQQKALGALNRGDYKTSITFAQKAFALSDAAFDISIVQLAAAASGNMEKFNEAARRYKEMLSDEYETYKLKIDSVEAFALAMSGQEALARSVIANWAYMDRIEGRLRSCWRNYPGGTKVVDNWLRLATH